ncbi:MAG: 5-formyltetrahydrofolate cyclo-ligase [Firmicutes bacterium]|nr:5-formyltetrahydrofolate cyclo-ligase [candidate division NPL-UPA2 bacterium]
MDSVEKEGFAILPDKLALRQEMLVRRSSLPAPERAEQNAAVVRRLLDTAWLREAKVLMAYLPTRGEVDLTELYDVLEGRGVALVFPKVTSRRARRMEPMAVAAPWRQHVTEGPLGMLEPVDGAKICNREAIDLALIPGVAFDYAFYRLGFGGGYYDRFLPELPSSTWLCGIAYSFQVVPCLPTDPHDVPLHALCTENECRLARPAVY